MLVLAVNLPLQAQQSERFGPYELHYTVVNSTFLEPKVASQYQIVRGEERAILNLAIREHLDDGTTRARSAKLEGRTWDLFQNQFFEFSEVREGDAIYYIGQFKFSDEELRFFEVTFAPEGATRSYEFRFQQKVYEEQ
ncbi:DUF4426 domain-containing protein [Halieaceae bacterium IMCC14734]|uniref:DUF4426 domain-containing protein n=1 Tax=Candidatus Litorirhabdus singularis TaxID=2518993 RepID=A0ABT3TCL0_9GAMM|nr:DUF4426 domain-containing protein [Candidatus Litorirhabdus singularis]